MKNVIGFTFGGKGPHKDFYKSKFELQTEAINTGWFKKFIAFGDTDLDRFTNSKKADGIGFWFWKSALALEVMNMCNQDDIIVYMDAGCRIFKNDISEKRFFEYIKMCDNGAGFVGFGGNSPNFPLEIQYTKRDTLILMGCDTDDYLYTTQMASGVWFIKNNKFARDLMEEWNRLCNIHHIINPEPSYNAEHPQFLSHRYEQSVLSLLCKKRRSLLDTCMLNPHEISEDMYNIDPNLTYPIKALRISDADIF